MEMTNQLERWALALEFLVLFVVLPLLIYWQLILIPKIVLLIIVAAYCGYQLWRDATFGQGLLRRNLTKGGSKSIFIRTPIVIVVLVTLVWILHPGQLFAFPAERPLLWIVVVLLYPFLSALPQEFIYRTFFFHRYNDLTTFPNASIIMSAIAFSFMHIIYDNWWAIVISFIGGLLFGITYDRTKSLFWVTVEHTIYGLLVFTLGMGGYFYEPF